MSDTAAQCRPVSSVVSRLQLQQHQEIQPTAVCISPPSILIQQPASLMSIVFSTFALERTVTATHYSASRLPFKGTYVSHGGLHS